MSLSNKDAFRAMFYFLDSYNKRSSSEDIEILLGSMSFLEDDYPVDPAIWEDWLDAIKKIENNCRDEHLNLE